MGDSSLSVVLPTYSGDCPAALSTAIDSVLRQSRPPDELLIVKDGPLSEQLETVVNNCEKDHPDVIETLQFPENRGLGEALRAGVETASHDLIARHDADDISVLSRFERQMSFLQDSPEVDIVGGYIEEFDEQMSEPLSVREVPTTHREIQRMAKFRCPMNHVTVMFRRQSVIDAGNYRSADPMEDYDLWVRMLLNGAKFANIPAVLTHVRAGDNMYSRRGGLDYAAEEIRLQRSFHRQNFISTPELVFNSVTRAGVRLIPNRIRKAIYELVART